jgi:hypothetical protein
VRINLLNPFYYSSCISDLSVLVLNSTGSVDETGEIDGIMGRREFHTSLVLTILLKRS